MEGAEHSRYVAQLKAEFDSCDTTATGFLNRDDLTTLCHKLQLDAHRTLLLDTLLRGRSYARVNFQEFKDGFVSVLSRSVDASTSEDDSSYLEPVVPDEVKPKFLKGTKRYGRRSRPDSEPDAALTFDSEDSLPSRAEAADSSPPGVRRAKLRRSTSLVSIESLKSDEEAGNQKITECKASQQEEEEPVRGGGDHVLSPVCDLGLQQLVGMDTDPDARVGVTDFQKILHGSTPVSCSTPVRPTELHRAPHRAQVSRSTSPSLLTSSVGQKVLSRVDDGSGWTSPERVMAVWSEEGIRNSRDILQTLDFPLDERLSLTDLTLALDNELLVSGNGIHQAALISYKNEIQHLQVCVEQSCRERDKVRADLDQADQRNLKLVREVDDRHASMEMLNQSRIRELEQDFRDRVTCLRAQCEQENEALLQQLERERGVLQEELRLQRAQEAERQEELCSATQENSRLEKELCVLKIKLTEAENTVNKLQRDLDQVLHDKFSGLDAVGTAASHEERFCEIVKDYELQCRELRDRNDELSSELGLLKSQRSDRKSRRSAADSASTADDLSWTQQQTVGAESDCDDSDMKRLSSPLVKKKLQPVDQKGLSSLEDVSGPVVSIQTELALETLKQRHEQELQQLHVQLDTQVNFYERSLELMRQSMELERKDISQAFKLEISELEENKAHVEQQVQQLKDEVDRVQKQLHHGGGGGWSNEQERRMQRERAELEQNFAREIGNLVHRLSTEKDQLEAELMLKMDQEVMVVREKCEQQLAHMKLHHAEGQRRLLHQDRQGLQEQRGFWESQLVQSEQRRSEEQDLLTRFSSEKTKLQEQVCGLQDAVQSSGLHIRARLIQDLKEQAIGVDQLQLDSLQGALRLEEELRRLRQENMGYARLADQLSTQIVEMEAEITMLREHLRDVSAQLNDTADLVLQLRTHINARDQQRATEDRFEEEKKKMRQQLMELETLVLALEEATPPQSAHRTQLEEVRVENSALQERLKVLQQEVLNLEDDIDKKRRKVDELQREHERGREEEEQLHRENSRYREEVLDLSGRNLQLSSDNAELSARLHGDQESLRLLRERLATVSKEQGEEGAEMRRLQTAATQQEREKQQVQAAWTQERLLLEAELSSCREKLKRVPELEAELSGTALKLQWSDEDKVKLQREANDRNNQVEALQRSILMLESDNELIRSQLHTATQDKLSHAQEVTELQRKLEDTRDKVEALEASVRTLLQEKEELCRDMVVQEERASITLQEETHRLSVQNQELHHKLSQLQGKGQDVQRLTQEQKSLKTQLSELEAARTQATDQVARAGATLSLVQAQHARQLQELQGRVYGRVESDHEQEHLETRLLEEQRRSQQLEETLKRQSQQITIKQDQYEQALASLQQRTDGVELKLKAVQTVLQEKVQQLKQQLVKNATVSALLKDVYVENGQLMKALQVTEQRQKQAEKKNFLLEEKVGALHRLLRDIVPTALAT